MNRLHPRALALACLAISLPALAIQPLVRGARLRPDAEPPHAKLDALRAEDGASVLTEAASRELDALAWKALVDPAGHPLRAWGAPIALAPADTLAFLAARPGLLGFRPGTGGDDLVAREPVRAGNYTVVALDQRWHGFPVEGVRADVRFRDGRAVMARLHLARGIDAARTPVIPETQALALANAAVSADGWLPSSAPRLDASRPLAIVRDGDRWALAWVVRIESAAPRGKLTVWIDAVDGSAIALRDEIRRGASVDTPLTLTVSHEPRRAGDVETISPLPFFAASDVAESFVTDTSGDAIVPIAGATRELVLTLAGPYVGVVLWEGSSAALVTVTSGVPSQFLWDGLSASLSERDAAASHAVVRARMKRMAPDLAWLDARIGIVTDIPDSDGCNAFWDGDDAQFYAESDTCNATARVADVVYHEIGHGLHQNLAVGGNLNCWSQ